jgi:hypothetical protein
MDKSRQDIFNLLELIGFKKYPKKLDTEYWEYDRYKCKVIINNNFHDTIFEVYKLNKSNEIEDVVYSNDFDNVYDVLTDEFKYILRKIKINKLLSDK